MKAAKIASQIKRFVHLFGGHVSENTQAFFFRQTLTVLPLEARRRRWPSLNWRLLAQQFGSG
jgi:hypothetical protein